MCFTKTMPLAALFAAAALAQQPAIIDRDLLFGDPEIAGAQLSPDGKYLAFIKPLDKTRNVWVKKIGEPFAAAKPVTAVTKRPIGGYSWSRDGKFILFVQDEGGDENFNVWAVNPADSPKAGEKAPAAKNLTAAEKVAAQIVHVSKVDPDTLFVGINDRDKAWHDIYKVKISTGERTLVRKNTDKVAGWEFDQKDNIRLASMVAGNGDQEHFRVVGDKLVKFATCTVFESCGSLRFHKDGKRIYYLSNAGSDTDLINLYLMDPETGKQELLESDPLKRVDFSGAIFNDDDDMEAVIFYDEKRRIYFKDKAMEADFNLLSKRFPGRDVNVTSRTRDNSTWLIAVNSDVEPGEVYVFDRKSKKTDLQYKVREKIDRSLLSSMKPISYPSSDGLVIPAYLTTPKGLEAKNLPLVVVPHGGPWARDMWGYNGMHQFLANRGYAVLSPNFRASTGFGKKFLNAGNGEWGRKMQDDITWGVQYLIKQGIADPKRVAIMGGSYGGYATLAGVAFTPDVYSAAVAIVAPSNLITLLDSIPPYWEAGRKIMYTRMADPGTPAGKADLQRMSPLHAASKIKTPLMVVQGANDPRVNQAESDQIVIALRDRNYPVKYLVAPDEGHGFQKPINNLAMFVAVERFFEQHLKGRSQKDVPEDVAKKLDDLTVDPKKVVLAKKLDTTKSAELKPSRPLATGTYNWGATLEFGAQKVNLNITTEIQKTDAGYTVTEKMAGPMGEAVDSALLEAGTLYLKSRSVKQGPVAIDLKVESNKVAGKMSMNGQDRPLNADLGGPLFAETGGQFAIGALPLAEGYETVYRNFDLQKAKEKLMSVKVAGSESVTVPAGTFDAWKVEVKPEDGGGTTYWIEKSSGKPVKAKSVMPQMNGATMTLELK
jgi:dipeptidyl aminopeptidase/acylaminoacyl peptidase